jgi:hypothetical protein
MSDLSPSQESQLVELVKNFGASFLIAQKDWATFKAGVAAGLFSTSQRNTVIAWFRDYPKFWDTIKLNFQDPKWITNPSSGTATSPGNLTVTDTGFSLQVDLWVSKLRNDTGLSGLGVIPLIVIIAGIIIAGILGSAAAIWSIGYYKQQSNITKMIDDVVAGKLSPAVLETAIKKEQESGGLFSELSTLAKWAIVGTIAFIGLPILRDVFGGKK